MFIRKIIDIVGNSKKTFAWYILLVYDLEFTTPFTNFRGGGQGLSIRQCMRYNYAHDQLNTIDISISFLRIF